jgi:hypothetical protein
METFEQLARHYSEREICDIVWLVAIEHLYNMSDIGLNIGSDGLCEALAALRTHIDRFWEKALAAYEATLEQHVEHRAKPHEEGG